MSTQQEFDYDTYADIWRMILWELEVVWTGEFPATDWDDNPWPPNSWRERMAGQRIMGNYFGVLVQVAADYEWLATRLAFRHWSENTPCSYCGCNRTDKPLTDFRPCAAWLNTIVSLEEWLAAPRQCQLFSHPIVHVNLFTIQLDVMHVMCLGVLLHMNANTLFTLIHDSGLPGTIEQRSFLI